MTQQKNHNKERGWKDIPIGGLILEAGNAAAYNTGSWRTFKPVVDHQKCINCLFCWVYCPDSSVVVTDGKMKEFDYDHCKGCGICANVCPTKAIEMKPEVEFND